MLRRLFLLAVVVGALVPSVQAQYFAFGKNRIQYDRLDWRYVQSEHFDVFFYEREASAPGGRVLGDAAARAAEAAYAEIAVLFDYEIADRIPILVYQSHNDFAVTNVAELPVYAEGIGGVTELFKNRIAIPFTGDWRDFRRVLHHELVHAVINDLFYGGSIQSILQNNLRLNIPLWFNEGLAEYAALGWDTQSDMYLRDAVLNNYLADIPYLNGYFAYRGGQGVWDYVAEEYGREKVGEILQRLRLSRSVDDAFRRATGLSLDELSERWKATLRTVYFPEIAAREDLGAVGRALVTDEQGGYYHTSPALSPQGDRVAYVAATNGLFDVFTVATSGTERPRKLLDGQDNAQFESLRILSPGLAWSPDGDRLAVAVKSGRSDAIALVDVDTRRSVLYRVPGLDAILSVAWSPDGGRIAFEATAGAQPDLYVLTLATGETVNYTNDLFSDHEPAWSPDGRSLVFHSDRGDYVATGRATAAEASAGRFDALAAADGQHDVYRLTLDAPDRLERLTFDAADDTNAEIGPDGRLLFVSDRNGIPNLFEKDLATGAERPLTDLQNGAIQVSLSADGTRAALLALHRGVPSIYLLRDPFTRPDAPDALAPTVWAQRQLGEGEAPSVALASAATRRRNPLLRAAVFSSAPDGPLLAVDSSGMRSDALALGPDTSGLGSDSTLLAYGTNGDADSTTYGDVRVDFRNYVFTDAFDVAADSAFEDAGDVFAPVDNVAEDGSLRVRRYRLRFTPDLVYAAGGYDTVFGVQSLTQMLFSDMLGNHRFAFATNLVLDLRNSDYLLSYASLGRRTDLSFEAFHLARELPDFDRATVYRYRNYGLTATASFPLDKFRRADATMAVLGVSLADLSDLGARPRVRTFLYPSVTYTTDHTVPGYLAPASGTRWAVSLAGSPGLEVTFLTALADARRYVSLGPAYSLAFRASAGASVGPDPQRFYAAGVPNWINPSFRSLPVEDPDDFVFATPVLPLRGFGYNEAVGDRFALANAELRVPLIAALLPGPLPILPLYNIQAVGFVDAGVIAEGAFTPRRTDAEGRRVFDDVLVGTGVGLRTIFLGYPLRVDWAWPYDGREFGTTRVHFSLGLDF